MPQPVLSGTHRTCTFGGLPQPNGQGVMATRDLNDLASWYLQDEAVFDVQEQLTTAQQAYLAEGSFLASDFPPLPLRLPMEYREGAAPLGAALPMLILAGEQQLAFDGSTCIRARCIGTQNRQTSFRRLGASPLIRWTFDLLFLCREPWWRDIAPATMATVALNSGSATLFNIAYAGSVFTRPVWTLAIPNTNAVPIVSFALTNTMSGESLTVAFPGNLAASTAWTVTIDTQAMTVTDQTGRAYDIVGTAFPILYQPAGTVNPFSATLTPASGTATGCTIGATYTPRWLI